ncbi:MAG: LamG-like jellyroll fold domain-containing protein [Candidatus Jorgensenbacteria bacterium]
MTSCASFTLIELLVVIAILGVLATVVILVINPAELIKQARDSTRLEDLGTINRILGLFQADQVDAFMGTSSIVYASVPDTSATCVNLGLPTLPSGWSYACAPTSTLQKADGTGWIPVNLTAFSAGSPLSKFPVDPVNTTSTSQYYTYVTGGSWELTAVTESSKYASKSSSDGGVDPAMLEVGSDPGLDLSPFAHGMVGYWMFDETGTTANDSSGYANTGTMYSSSTISDLHTSSNCKAGSCVSLDGTDDYVRIPTLGPYGSFTYLAWIKSTNINSPSTQPIIHGPSEGWNSFNINSSKLRYGSYGGVGCGGANSFSNTSLASNTSYFVAMTYNRNGQWQSFINGALDSSTNHNCSPGSGVYDIGSASSYSAQKFYGIIDDVRIYNRALSASEISAIYNATQ